MNNNRNSRQTRLNVSYHTTDHGCRKQKAQQHHSVNRTGIADSCRALADEVLPIISTAHDYLQRPSLQQKTGIDRGEYAERTCFPKTRLWLLPAAEPVEVARMEGWKLVAAAAALDRGLVVATMGR